MMERGVLAMCLWSWSSCGGRQTEPESRSAGGEGRQTQGYLRIHENKEVKEEPKLGRKLIIRRWLAATAGVKWKPDASGSWKAH